MSVRELESDADLYGINETLPIIWLLNAYLPGSELANKILSNGSDHLIKSAGISEFEG